MLPANSVHACITSPPYWGLRDYGTATWAGGDPACDHRNGPLASPRSTLQSYTGAHVKLAVGGMPFQGTCGRCGAVRHDQGLGNEAVPDCLGWATGQPCGGCWVCRLVAVMREVRRVLRPDGTLWMNVGDAYASSGVPGLQAPTARLARHGANGYNPKMAQQVFGRAATPPGLKPKDLCMLPARLALALQHDGWWLRSEIIWSKKNPLPESVTDRPTKAHEMVYLLTKSPHYHFDSFAIREPAQDWGLRDRSHAKHNTDGFRAAGQPPHRGLTNGNAAATGRQCRSVWSFASEPTPLAHFATFPSALVRRCLLASCSAGGVCAGCGTPYRRQVERGPSQNKLLPPMPSAQVRGVSPTSCLHHSGAYRHRETTTTGFAPACDCSAGVMPATVIDPFMGSGTTLLTARGLFIKSVGIELSPSYCALAASRLTQGVLALAPGVCEDAGWGLGVVAHPQPDDSG